MLLAKMIAADKPALAPEGAAGTPKAGVDVDFGSALVGERFIPVPRHRLIERLSQAAVWPGVDLFQVRTLFRSMAHWRQLSYTERQHALNRAYLPFNPDSDEGGAQGLSADEREDAKRTLISLVRELLERANYEEVPRERLQDVLDEQNPYGLDFDLNLKDYEEVQVYTRGEYREDLTASLVDKAIGRDSRLTVVKFQRLFVLLQLKGEEKRIGEIMADEKVDEKKARRILKRSRRLLPPHLTSDIITMKLFKGIPRSDMEMLFPTTRVKFKKRDKLTFGFTAGGGMAGAASKLTAAAAMTPGGVGVAAIAMIGVAGQQFNRFMQVRTRYMAQLAQNLYFQNLANNQGVLTLLSERGLEEDIKEEMLLYTLLARKPHRRAELWQARAAISAWLTGEFGVTVKFDTGDALERLERDGLVGEAADGTLATLAPAEAAQHIDAMWDEYLDRILAAEEQGRA